MTLRYMRYLATGLVTLLLPLSALSVELFLRTQGGLTPDPELRVGRDRRLHSYASTRG
jgi:hypothetical protein